MTADQYREKLHSLQAELSDFLKSSISDYDSNRLEDIYLTRKSKDIQDRAHFLLSDIGYALTANEERGIVERRGIAYYLGKIQLRQGTAIEVELTHPDTGKVYLYCTEVQQSGSSYYLKGFKDIPLDGLKARLLW